MACACMTGSDESRIRRLPDTSGMKNRFVVQKAHRSPFDRAILLTGAQFVEVPPDETELERSLGGDVAGLFHTEAWFCPREALPLRRTAEISHKFGIPSRIHGRSCT